MRELVTGVDWTRGGHETRHEAGLAEAGHRQALHGGLAALTWAPLLRGTAMMGMGMDTRRSQALARHEVETKPQETPLQLHRPR